MEFTEEEVIEELRGLGYDNVPKDKLNDFLADLKQLARHERSKSDTDNSFASSYEGLSQYPSHTSFHWGSRKSRSSSRAFETSKVPVDESFSSTSFNSTLDAGRPTTAPSGRWRQTADRPEVADESSLSTSSVVRRKVSRRDAAGNRDISLEEVTRLDEDDDKATYLDEFEDLDQDEIITTLPRPLRHVRPLSAASDSSASSLASSRSLGGRLPAYIRPEPEVRRKRHDPVNRYHQYKEAWTSQLAPGEKQHKQLRWAVREQMQHKDQIVVPVHRRYVPNTFVVPTEKKRQNLRWEIRTKLAHKLNPSQPTAFDVWM